MAKDYCNRRIDSENGIKSRKTCIHAKYMDFSIKQSFRHIRLFCKNGDSLKLHFSNTTDSGSMKMPKVDCKRRVDNENGIKSRKTCIHV